MLKIHAIAMFVCKKSITILSLLFSFFDIRSNYLWLCFVHMIKLSDQLNDMKMAAEVKHASALNRHQGRQLCCVKRYDSPD